MKIEVLRLSHRLPRDQRVSTHVALTARALNCTKIFYSGQKDSTYEDAISSITNNFGGPFEIEYTKNPVKLVKEKKAEGFVIIHLSMYCSKFESKLKLLKNKDILFIVGSEKVDREFYEISDFNLSVSNQPISEVSALGIILYKLYGFKNIFKNAKIKINPSERGKITEKQDF